MRIGSKSPPGPLMSQQWTETEAMWDPCARSDSGEPMMSHSLTVFSLSIATHRLAAA